MSTTAEATEGQAKIQDALRDGMYYAQRAMDHDSSLGKMKSADEAEAAFDRMAAARIIAQGIAQAPQSSPAPSVIEAGDAMLSRLQHSSPKCLSGEKCVCGLAEIYERWVAAKASRPSVTAPQGVTVDQIMKVVWTWAMDAKMVSATTEPYYLTNDLRSRLSALPTNPK